VTASGWTCTAPKPGTKGGTVVCTVDPLASGANVSTSIGVTVKAPAAKGVLTNAATVSSDTGDPSSSNNTATVTTTVTK
jgi:Domain of unknown function DUF11